MNWDEIKGDWKVVSSRLNSRWEHLTADNHIQINLKRDELSGRLQKQFGHTKEEAEMQIKAFLKGIKGNH